MKYAHRYPAVSVAAFVLTISSAACAEHTVGGRTADEVFRDPAVAEVARAACTGDVGAIAKAAEAGVDIDAAGFQQATPLYWAITCENPRGVEALLEAGADPNRMYGREGGARFDAVYQAATYTDSRMLRVILEHGGNPDGRQENSADSPIMRALTVGRSANNWENWDLLINVGADINQADSLGHTIATSAAALGAYDQVAGLLDRGYTCNLDLLGRYVQGEPFSTDQLEEQQNLMRKLADRGVTFPVSFERARETLGEGCSNADDSE